MGALKMAQGLAHDDPKRNNLLPIENKKQKREQSKKQKAEHGCGFGVELFDEAKKPICVKKAFVEKVNLLQASQEKSLVLTGTVLAITFLMYSTSGWGAMSAHRKYSKVLMLLNLCAVHSRWNAS